MFRKGSWVESTQPWAWGGLLQSQELARNWSQDRREVQKEGLDVEFMYRQVSLSNLADTMTRRLGRTFCLKSRPWLSSHKKSRACDFFQVGPGVPDREDLA